MPVLFSIAFSERYLSIAATPEEIAIRLQNVQIECCNALRIINSRDVSEAFFYVGPSYVGSFQGHYDGYDQDDFDKLLQPLGNINGKFLLSLFRNKNLSGMEANNNWSQIELKMAKLMSAQLGKIV